MGSITDGAKGFADAIKSKIKANEESRVSGTILDSLEARIAQNAAKTGSTGELEGFSKSFDALRKAKLSATETLAVAKAIAPDMFSTDAKTKGVYMVKTDPDTNETYMVNATNNERVTDPNAIGGNSSVFKETLTPEAMGQRALASREATTENPQLDEKTTGAIAALEFSAPRLDNALKILDEIGEKDFEKLTTQIQIGANNEFIVPNGSPLEELVAELNDVKITGFGIAGAAYTGNEREVVEGGLNPIAKGYKRFRRDLMRNKDFFSARAKAGTMGLKKAREVASGAETYSAGKSDGKKIGKFKIVSVE